MRRTLPLLFVTLSVSVNATVDVSVCHDATYSLSISASSLCSGSGSSRAGTSCPKAGDVAVADCHSYLPSYVNGSCVAPEDSVCELINGDTWGCVLPSVGCNATKATKPKCETWAYSGNDSVNLDNSGSYDGSNYNETWFIQTTALRDLNDCPSTPTPTPAATTAAPVTPAPTTAAPVTPAPTTAAPVTPAPTTAAPVTPAPTTAAPVTPAPTTATPVTPAPTTATPVTPAPTTLTPSTPTSTPAPTTPTQWTNSSSSGSGSDEIGVGPSVGDEDSAATDSAITLLSSTGTKDSEGAGAGTIAGAIVAVAVVAVAAVFTSKRYLAKRRASNIPDSVRERSGSIEYEVALTPSPTSVQITSPRSYGFNSRGKI